jgi:tetratricopeptide (TPR) repeat protein
MRKISTLMLLFCVPFLIFAQDAAQFTAETDHYRVYSETTQAQANDVAVRMEAALALYNGIFHFDLSLMPSKLRVRVFKDLDSFNAYLDKVLSQKRSDFVFIAWSDPERSELLCFPKEDSAFTASLLHQGCIQFMKAFIDNPPIWLREGVATYLDASAWDAKTSSFVQKPNFAWLPGLKALIRAETPSALIPFTDFFTLSREKAQAQMDVFAPQSWGLVQFLIDAPDRAYSRAMWDSLSSLSPKATLDENSQRAVARGFAWVTEKKLQQDYQTHILGMKTAADLVKDGIDLYMKPDLAGAEAAFTKSLALEPSSSAAWYYLGLIAYARKDYTAAEDAYLKAFELGANAGIINYALGVNSFAAGKNADAAKYLSFAKQADKTAYGSKADALLKRIESTK